MNSGQLVIDLVIVLLLALFGGLAAHWLRQPPLLGYMAAGVLLQTGVFGYRIDSRNIQAIAELGVAFLMFSVGVEFSLRGLLPVGRVVLWGGALQVGLTVLLGYGAGRLLGWAWYPSLFLGCVIAMSSTMLVMKLLGGEGRLHTRPGVLLLGLLICQDLMAVALMALLPALRGLSLATLPAVGVSLLRTAFVLAVASLLAFVWVPWVLRVVAGARSKELLILAAVGICLAAAVGTYRLGFSVALGAFLAGLIISESEYCHEILAEVIPIRDLFASLFFVALGMIFQPVSLLRTLGPVLLLTFLVLAKAPITAGVVAAFGYHPRVAILVGMGLTQIGEFSFVLARVGLDEGLVSPGVYSLVISTALLTMCLTPWMFRLATALARRLPIEPPSGPAPGNQEAKLAGHVIVCGCGRAGRQVARALDRFAIPYVVVDYDRRTVRALREEGTPALFGDASREAVLRRAHPETAASAVIALPDDFAATLVLRTLHQLNPELPVVARGHSERAERQLEVEGADEVVVPEFEAGLEMVRHALLHNHGVAPDDLNDYVAAERERRYHPHQHPSGEEALASCPGPG